MAKKYVSVLNDGTQDLTIKDAEARTTIEPISSPGTAGKLLVSSGTSTAPVWKTGELVHVATSVSGTAAVTTSGHYYSSIWSGTCDGVTSLYTGLTVNIKIPVAGNGTYGTVMNINSLGEKPVVINVNTMVGTKYDVGCILTLVYDASQTATAYFDSGDPTTVTGVWKMSDSASSQAMSFNQISGKSYYELTW